MVERMKIWIEIPIEEVRKAVEQDELKNMFNKIREAMEAGKEIERNGIKAKIEDFEKEEEGRPKFYVAEIEAEVEGDTIKVWVKVEEVSDVERSAWITYYVIEDMYLGIPEKIFYHEEEVAVTFDRDFGDTAFGVAFDILDFAAKVVADALEIEYLTYTKQ